MKKRGVILGISFLSAVVIFILITILQNKIINPSGRAEVYFAKRAIQQNTVLNSSNISYYFSKKTVSKDTLISSPVSSISELSGKYVEQDIIKGQQISKSELLDNSKRIKDIKNPVEYSLKMDDISQTVGGTLREGDTIDLILTQSSNQSSGYKTLTEIPSKLSNILVVKAFTVDGKIVSREDGNKYAASILNLKLSAKNAAILDNALNRGKIKAVKSEDNSKVNNIKIEN